MRLHCNNEDSLPEIEIKQLEKIISASKNYNLLDKLDLAEYFITSKAEKIKSENKEELKIEVKKTKGTKCPRCWKILDNKCVRCAEVIKENFN